MAYAGVSFALAAIQVFFAIVPSSALVWTPKSGEASTQLQALSATRLHFNLASIDVATAADGAMSLRVSSWPTLGIPGEPDLPVLRQAMLLPRGVDGPWRVEVRDIRTEVFHFPQWGQRIQHSQGRQSVCSTMNNTIPATASAYQGVYPVGGPSVSLASPHVWRDVVGTVVEVLPVAVDHDKSTVTVMHSCTIDLVSDSAPLSVAKPLVIDPDFYGVYSFVYSNWEHYTNAYIAAEKPGRVLVVYGSQFKTQAQEYANLVKERLSQEAILYAAGQSSSVIKDTISKYYKEAAGLSYVTIIGRDVPTPRGSRTRSECDNCYAMLSGSTTLDIFVGRLSGATASDIDTQIAKIKAYSSSSKATWNEKAHGSCYPAPWDPSGYEQLFIGMMKDLGDMGFTQHEYVMSTASGAGRKALQQMNDGIGVFGYIGHGSGTAWNTPSMGVRDVQRLTNNDKPFFSLDCSCDNGGFQSHHPSLAESLLTSKGGAIATMMSAPTIDTCCLDYLRASTQVLKSGKVSRVGPVYVAALAAAQVAAPNPTRAQSYNVFGDPTLKLAFAVGGDPSVLV